MPILIGLGFAEIVGGQMPFLYTSFLFLPLITNIYICCPYGTCMFVYVKVLDLSKWYWRSSMHIFFISWKTAISELKVRESTEEEKENETVNINQEFK